MFFAEQLVEKLHFRSNVLGATLSVSRWHCGVMALCQCAAVYVGEEAFKLFVRKLAF